MRCFGSWAVRGCGRICSGKKKWTGWHPPSETVHAWWWPVADGSYAYTLNGSLLNGLYLWVHHGDSSWGTGRLVGSFAEFSVLSNAYRGKLLGLMAAHLVLLLGINTLHPGLTVRVWGTRQSERAASSPYSGKVQTLRHPEEHIG